MLSSAIMTATNRTFYTVESVFHLRESIHERSSLRSHRAASAARRFLETHQRRRSLGRALLGVRPPKLLYRARGPLSSRRGRPACPHSRDWRFHTSAGDAGLHDVWLRAGDACSVRPESDVRHGRRGGRPDVRLLGGWFVFDSPDAALLVSLLPRLVHVRGVERLSVLVRLVGEESCGRSAGRDLVLSRLVDVLLVEALRSTPGEDAPPGLLRGLVDAHLASAMRQMHAQLARSWTVAQLAKTAALSRSAFFERFARKVGLPPMEYLLAWRMAVAKDLLRRHNFGLAQVAERVGYCSASTFSTAFSRHVGQPPSRYVREH